MRLQVAGEAKDDRVYLKLRAASDGVSVIVTDANGHTEEGKLATFTNDGKLVLHRSRAIIKYAFQLTNDRIRCIEGFGLRSELEGR